MKQNWKFQKGGGRGMDIFWNNTMYSIIDNENPGKLGELTSNLRSERVTCKSK